MLAIRRGLQEDLAAVDAIQSASPEASHWNVADYLTYGLWVAVAQDRIAGFVVSRSVGAGEGELLNVAVAQEFRRSGVGTALVRAVLEEFPGGVFLEVRESNVVAVNLYKSMGFKAVGRRQDYYEFPTEAAIVMKFHSC